MSQPQRESKGMGGAIPAAAPEAAHAASARPLRQALLVPGMHRSGTSALTGVLSHLGAQLPRTLLPNARDNPRGFWESAEVVKFNDRILASAGSRWDDWEPFNRDWMQSAAAEPFLERVPELLDKEYGDARLLLLKDPRVCRLMPFWTEALRRLDIAPHVVIPLRHPGEVASSLEARNRFGRNRALLIWLRHVLEAERATRGMPRTLLFFEDLLRDWRGQCKRISEELGIVWPRWSGTVEVEIDNYLSADLRHQRVLSDQVTPNEALQGWIGTVLEALEVLVATQGRDPVARAALDGVLEDFDRRSSIFASVVAEYALASEGMKHELESLRGDAEALAALRVEDARKSRLIDDLESAAVANGKRVVSAEAAADNVAAQLALQDRVLADMRILLAEREKELQAVRDRAMVQTEDLRRQVEEIQARHAGELEAAKQREAQALASLDELRARTAEAERARASSEKSTNGLKGRIDAWVTRIEAGARQLADENKELELKCREQERQISERFKEIERLTLRLIRSDQKLSERDSHAESQRMHIEELEARLQAMEASRTWRFGSPARRLVTVAKGLRKPRGKEDAALVRQSDLFDVDWYIARYPDVAAAGIDPVAHYLEFGAKEGRDPGPMFDSRYYLQTYPDVVASGINPLVHFLRHGQSEDRKTRPIDA